MKKALMVFILAAGLTGCAGTALEKNGVTQSVVEENQGRLNEIPLLFNQAQTQAVFVSYDGTQFKSYGNDLSRAQTAYVPASTFKMLNALIALQHKKVTTDEIFKWNGQKQYIAAWEKDMNLAEAMQVSNFPLFQILARRTGTKLMQQEVTRVGYGNAETGTVVDRFWLDGPLKITPEQEAEFAYKLATEQLPFDANVQKQVKDMLLIERRGDAKLYAKSGLSLKEGQPGVGWYVGWVDNGHGKITAFALNMQVQPENVDLNLRKQLTLDVLDKLGVFFYL